ncbi:hypothetical protein HMPREF1980_01508 [Actinomyces sp. oral taxon 172 str. F0311]|nr:hypothetical protein HMPREF1980_01508 [Actinomyces sp. oral taxon 172 str. F0311]
MSAFVAEVVCTSGATPPRTATSPPRTTTSPPRTATSPPPNGGNCTNRGATRRRHAEARLLMLQNPHHDPRRHAPSLAPCSLTSAGQPGGAPINACRASPTGPCCTGAGRAGADKRQKGVAERTGAGTRVARSATTLAADQVKHPIGDHSTRSDRAQCSRSG